MPTTIILLSLLSLVAIPLLALVVLVVSIRRRRFSLKWLFVLPALFGLLLLPIVEFQRVAETMPQPVLLPLEGGNRWVTPPLANGEYWVTLFYERGETRRLPGRLMVKVFDEETFVVATPPNMFGFNFGGPDTAARFVAIERHSYRIEVDGVQAKRLAGWRCRLSVHRDPACL